MQMYLDAGAGGRAGGVKVRMIRLYWSLFFRVPIRLRWPCGLALWLLTPVLPAQGPKCMPSTGHIDMAQGSYSSQPGVTFLLHHFNATLVPQSEFAPLCYQKFTVVSRAVIFVSSDSLTRVFSQKLTGSNSKIRDLQIINSADGVTLKGTMDKLIPIHFSISGPVTTDGTALQVHADRIVADGIPIKTILALVGQHLSTVLGLKDMAGVSVEENTMSFFPEQIAHLKGHLYSVATSAKGLTLTYTPASRRAVLAPGHPS